MAIYTFHYSVNGLETHFDGSAPYVFCNERYFSIQFSTDGVISHNFNLGNGYRLDVGTCIPGTGRPWIEYTLEKDGSPFSLPNVGVDRGTFTSGRQDLRPDQVLFPYWHFYANVDSRSKVWIRFRAIDPIAALIRAEEEAIVAATGVEDFPRM